MSFLDKIASAVMPAASDEERAQARRHAQTLTRGDDWLGQVLAHHRLIENAFEQAFAASGAQARTHAMKELAQLLTGHSIAEEVVLYPAIVEHSGKTHAGMAFEEQSMAKVQMAKLEQIDPASDEWRKKLDHIRSAVQQHVYEEEHSYYPDIVANAPESVQQMLSSRYAEEFGRYCGPTQRAMPESRQAVPLA